MAAIIVLRIVHIFFGVFWAGGVMFLNFVVGPALAASGPDGMRVMQVMHKRRLFHVILGAALLSILSGIDLLRRDSGNFSAGWFRSPMGMGLSTGMLAAIIAFLIGLLAINPAMNRMSALVGQMMQAAPEARDGFMAQIGAARARMIAFGMVGMLFIVIAVLTMATARYWS
jgi:uncharacterized membrane protein